MTPGPLVELLERLGQLDVHLVIVERALDVADVVEQALEDVRVGSTAAEALDRRQGRIAEVRVLLVTPADADQVEALR